MAAGPTATVGAAAVAAEAGETGAALEMPAAPAAGATTAKLPTPCLERSSSQVAPAFERRRSARSVSVPAHWPPEEGTVRAAWGKNILNRISAEEATAVASTTTHTQRGVEVHPAPRRIAVCRPPSPVRAVVTASVVLLSTAARLHNPDPRPDPNLN